jgi:hypothetical protein
MFPICPLLTSMIICQPNLTNIMVDTKLSHPVYYIVLNGCFNHILSI